MQQRFIRISELTSTPARNGRPAQPGRWPVASATVWRWVSSGVLPAPVRLGPQVSAWPIEVIEAYEKAQAAVAADVGQKVQAASASVVARRAKRQQVGA